MLYLIQHIYPLQNGETVEYGDGTDNSLKYNLKKFGDKFTFSINSVITEDAGLYELDVEDANMFTTELNSKSKFDYGTDCIDSDVLEFHGMFSGICIRKEAA